MIINLKDDDWKKEKNEWKAEVENIIIPDEIQGKYHHLNHELDKLYSKASYHANEYTTMLDNIEDVINTVYKENKDEGKNKEERESNAMKFLHYYPTGDKKHYKTNLIELRNKIRTKANFYKNYVLKNLEIKTDRLNTNIGASKIDAKFSH